MHLASDQSDEDLQRRWAAEEVEQAIVALTANLMRVTRGAGKPWDVLPQTQELLRAAHQYYDLYQQWPQAVIERSLKVADPMADKLDDAEWELSHAVDTIVRGSLQVAASRLLSQRTQISAGERELIDGVGEREKALKTLHAKLLPNFLDRHEARKPRKSSFD